MEVHAQLCGSKQGAVPVPTLPFLRYESALGVDRGHHFEINTVSSQGTGLVGVIDPKDATYTKSQVLFSDHGGIIIHFSL